MHEFPPSPLGNSRSPPPSFHYTVRKRTVRQESRTAHEPPRTKVELYEPTNKLPCHTSKRLSRSLRRSLKAERRIQLPSSAGFPRKCLKAIATASPQDKRAQQSSVRVRAAAVVLAAEPNSRTA